MTTRNAIPTPRAPNGYPAENDDLPGRVIVTDAADAEAEHLFDWLFGFNAPAAFRFRDAFSVAAASLSEFPAGHPIAEENDLYERTVRRKIFKSGRKATR